MISIITACYNSEATISRAIESLLNQTDLNYEHIIVDGLSSDNTMNVVEKYEKIYKEKGIKLTVVSEKDQGIYDAMNKGIQLAKGEIVGILNSDDWYEKDTVKIINELNQQYPQVDIIMGASNTINGDITFVKRARNRAYITSRDFNHGSMFVKKECYNEIGLYENNGNIYDDFMWFIRAKKNNREFLIVDDVLYNFACGGISTKKSIKDMVKRIKYRYEAYAVNGCSKIYIIESIIMEIVKFLAVRK